MQSALFRETESLAGRLEVGIFGREETIPSSVRRRAA
jgi:hypothetical protein